MKFSALSTQALLASSCLVAGSFNSVAGSEKKNTVAQKPAGFLRRGLTTYADWKKQQDKQNGKPQGGGKSDAPSIDEPSAEHPEEVSEESLESLEEVSEASLESIDEPSAEHPEEASEESFESLEEASEESLESIDEPSAEHPEEASEESLESLEEASEESLESLESVESIDEAYIEDRMEVIEKELDGLEEELEEIEEEEKRFGRPDVAPGKTKTEESGDEDDKEPSITSEDSIEEPSIESEDSPDEAEDEDLFDAYCESVWAYDPATGASTCFSDIEGLKTNRWGWSVGPLADGPTILDIYAGAGVCDLEKGLLLGRANVMYDAGMDELSIDFERALSMLPEDTPLEYEEISWYIGHEPVLQKANGKYTVAPGQFPYKESHIEGSVPTNAVQFDVGSVSEGVAAPLYLALHGVVCDTAADQL